MEKELKTGAVICTKLIAGTDLLEYEALLFVKNIPADFSNEQFEKATLSLLKVETKNCYSLLFRSDINSTSNEVWEQYKGLNNDEGKASILLFEDLNFSV